MANGLCVCRCAWATNKQLAERWAKGGVHYLSRPRLPTGRAMPQLDNDGGLPLAPTEIGQFGTNDPPHGPNDKMARLREMMDLNGEKGGGSG